MSPSWTKEDLERLTLQELQKLAREHRIPGAEKLRRHALVERLLLLSQLRGRRKDELQKVAQPLLGSSVQGMKKDDLILRLLESERARTHVSRAMSEQGQDGAPDGRRQIGRAFRKLLAGVLMTAGVLGILVSLLGAVATPIVGTRVAGSIQGFFKVTQRQAESTGRLLRSTTSSLDRGIVVLRDTETILGTVEETLVATDPFLASVESLVGERGPDTIQASQEAITGSAMVARNVDQFLRTLDSLRLITGVTYRPEEPLDESLLGVAESLAPLKPGFLDIRDNLRQVREELVLVGPALESAERDLADLSESLDPIVHSIEAQAEALDSLALEIERSETRIANLSAWLIAGMTIGCVWAALSQCVVFLVGKDLWSRE